MRRKHLLQLVSVFFLAFVFFPVTSWAALDWIRSNGFSASANGRGGTSIAIGDDPSNMELNPAVISATENYALETNLMLLFPDFNFEYTGTGGQRYKSTDKNRLLLAPGMSFAKKIKDSPWSWGLSLAAPDAIATDYTIQSKFFGPVNASSEILHLRFGPAGAYQITPELSIGARLGIDYGSMDMRMPLGTAIIDLGQCDGFGISGALGLFYTPRKNLSFGIYYESPTMMEDLKTQNADGYIGVATPMGNMYFSDLDVTLEDVQFPQNFGLGMAYSPIPSLRLSADVKYINWKSNWEELSVKYSGAGADAMKAAGMPTTLKIPLNIDNQFTVGVGGEYFLGEMYKFSLGYSYNDNAMEDNFLLPYAPAEVEHTLSLGFAYMPTKSVKIALAYMYAIMDDSKASSHHGYDQSLEQQLGMPPGALQSELNDSETKYNAQALQISASFYW